ncbi:MAG: hypothetical protein AB4040_13670, partial [Synechococcus sp.]
SFFGHWASWFRFQHESFLLPGLCGKPNPYRLSDVSIDFANSISYSSDSNSTHPGTIESA